MANKKIIEQKQQQVNAIGEKVKSAGSVVLVDYRGITVEQDTQLRNEFRKNNVEYKVIKNRIMTRAFENAGFSGYDDLFKGPTAVAFSISDPTAAPKILGDFVKKTKITVKGGMVEGKRLDANGINALASIPAKPVLIGQLLGLLTNPMRSMAVAISEIAKKKEASQ